MARHLTHVIVHHSLSPDGVTRNADAIRRYHVEHNGWSDVGYHFLVELIGSCYESVTGRPITQNGAHCKELGMNRNSIGVCLIGNFDIAVPNPAQLAELVNLIKHLMSEYKIPARNVLGHREVGKLAGYDWEKIGRTGVRQYKTCPGTHFDMDELRRRLK